jgi:hypothetical protein
MTKLTADKFYRDRAGYEAESFIENIALPLGTCIELMEAYYEEKMKDIMFHEERGWVSNNSLSQLSFADLVALYEWNNRMIRRIENLIADDNEDFKPDLAKALRLRIDVRRELNDRTEKFKL